MARMNQIQSAGDNIIHVVSTRIRVKGAGFLRQSVHSIDDINNKTLDPITMSAATNKPATKLANFRDTRIQLKIFVNDIDETFTIGTFYIFSKPVATSYPLT